MGSLVISEEDLWKDIGEKMSSDECTNSLRSTMNEVVIFMENSCLAFGTSDIQNAGNRVADIMNELLRFTEGIHYAVSEDIDIPFSQKLSEVADMLIDLNPNDFYFGDGSPAEYFNDFPSYRGLFTTLCSDRMSPGQTNDAKYINFLFEDFEKADEMMNLAYNLFGGTKVDPNWDNLTPAEQSAAMQAYWVSLTPQQRKEMLEEYYGGICQIYYPGVDTSDSLFISFEDVGEGRVGYVDSDYTTIHIDEQFIDNPETYTLADCLDTINHESRHQEQHAIFIGDVNHDDIPDEGIVVGPHRVTDEFDYTNAIPVGGLGYHSSGMEEDAYGWGAISTPE